MTTLDGNLYLRSSDHTWSETPGGVFVVHPDGTWNRRGPLSLCGATVNVEAGFYPGAPGSPVDLASAAGFDAAVGLKMASRLQKVYLEPGELPTDWTKPPLSSWKTFVDAGGELLISFRPPIKTSPATDAQFQACVSGVYENLGDTWKAVLWQEPNTTKAVQKGMLNASMYHDYVAHYSPLGAEASAHAIPLVYDPALAGATDGANANSVVAYYPGDQFTDEVAVDFYGASYLRGSVLDAAIALADNHKPYPVPFSLAEWGPAASDYPFDPVKWQQYVDYLTSVFVGRMDAGLTNGWFIYWGSDDQGRMGKGDTIASSSDSKVAGVRQFVQAVGKS